MKRLVPLVGPWLVGAVVALFILGTPTLSRAATCRADSVLLGQLPALTGQTSTGWFNVFGFDFDSAVPPTITFSTPVIPYPGEAAQVLPPSVTSILVPASVFDGSFKMTFRARDTGVRTITVRMAGNGCVASTVVELTLPGTSTDNPAPPSLGGLAVTLLASAGAVAALWRRLHAVEQSQQGR